MKKLLFTLAAISLITFGACKKEVEKEEDKKEADKTPTPPTLDKNLLTNSSKIWETQSGNSTLEFKANGILNSSGTWKWLNNSDSMEIKLVSAAQTYVWYFKYCQGDSMETKTTSTGGFVKYKDHNW